MKSNLIYLFLCWNLLACNYGPKPIEKIWISKYHVSNNEMEEEVTWSPSFRGFLSFDRDSVIINDFQYIGTSKNVIKKIAYSLSDSSLVLFNLDGNDSIDILLSDSQLVFKMYPKVNHVFEVLPTYNQVKDEEKLRNYLASFTYKIVTDTFQVFYEFQKNYKIFSTTPHKNLVIDDIAYWNLNSIGTELFLELNDFYRNTLHIQEIKENEIKGVVYDKENREVVLQRVLPQNRFDLTNLIGEWEEIIDYPEPPPPPPPPPGRQYYEKEILKISEKELIKHRFLGSDTLEWQVNRLGDKLFIPKYFQEIGAWTIKKLDDEYLYIDRKWIHSGGLSLRWIRKEWGQKDFIEHIKFKKIKK